MKTRLVLWALLLFAVNAVQPASPTDPTAGAKVFILPVRENIMPPMVYLIRRGVKEAMEAKADLLVLDMKTDGGRVDVTEEIIQILSQFKGQTVTYVNDRAFSAGAFIAVATQKIFMAPQSVIGAAAPILMMPGGSPQEAPQTMEIKMTSAVRALVRRVAEKNGHNVEVVEAMIDKNKELILDGKTINRKGDILTLTDTEAAREYGEPPRALLSAGTVESIDALLRKLGFAGAARVEIKPTGAEKIGTWINNISPILLIIGVIGLYIEFKTPGFGLPGIVGLTAFGVYFLGGYIAGFSGAEWVLVFLLGLVMVALELFVFPGTLALGIIGAFFIVAAIVMALVDVYPSGPDLPGVPNLPTFSRQSFQEPLRVLTLALVGSALGIWLLSRFLPKTSLYNALISQSASGVTSVAAQQRDHSGLLGQTGVTTSPLRPGGKAQFGERILDVISQGDMVPRGQTVRIIGFSGTEAIVETVA